tara:strand:- start:7651 stop:7884 length:234 start_codon:yes stop_codon:yes gene_type:complete
MQVYKTTGVMPRLLLEKPEFPDELFYLWKWHCEMGNAQAISNLELKAWADLNKIELDIWEVEVLHSLDQVYWEIVNE